MVGCATFVYMNGGLEVHIVHNPMVLARLGSVWWIRMFKQLFIFCKWLVVLVLFVIFLHFFGIRSLERYLKKKVLVTKTNELVAFIPAPAITICPFNPETGFVFANDFSKEEKHEMRENVVGHQVRLWIASKSWLTIWVLWSWERQEGWNGMLGTNLALNSNQKIGELSLLMLRVSVLSTSVLTTLATMICLRRSLFIWNLT